MKNKVRLSGILSESLANGEGLRQVIFSQTCYHNCKGCFNPETHSPHGGQWFNTNDVISTLKANPLLNGVTFSGGDPFEQAVAFAHIAHSIRRPSFTVWCYTGYTYDYLLTHQSTKPGWKTLLNNIDVLIDGPFEEALHDANLKYRGSSNQRIIDLPTTLRTGTLTTLCYE